MITIYLTNAEAVAAANRALSSVHANEPDYHGNRLGNALLRAATVEDGRITIVIKWEAHKHE